MIADGSVGQVVGFHRHTPGVGSPVKDLGADFGTAGEVDLRGIAWWQVMVAEKRTAYNSSVRSNFIAFGKVPLEDNGIDSTGVLRTVNPVLVQRNDINAQFESTTQDSGAVLARQHAAQAEPENQVLSAGRAVHGRPSPGKHGLAPAGMAQHVNRGVSGNLRRQWHTSQATEQNQRNGFFHRVFRVMANGIRLAATVQTGWVTVHQVIE